MFCDPYVVRQKFSHPYLQKKDCLNFKAAFSHLKTSIS